MAKLKPILLPVLFISAVTIIIIGFIYKPKATHTAPIQTMPTSFVYVEKNELLKDMAQYPNISDCVKADIVNTVVFEAKRYNINPLILYSLLHVESSMQFWLTHKPVIITIHKKKIHTAAIGLGGVIWEWWGEKLVKAGIAQVKSDLYDPIKNIRATAFIYGELYKIPKHISADSQDESAMLRYFGGDFKVYFEKIDSKVGEIVSKIIYRKKK